MWMALPIAAQLSRSSVTLYLAIAAAAAAAVAVRRLGLDCGPSLQVICLLLSECPLKSPLA
jgi:hypothetical protein